MEAIAALACALPTVYELWDDRKGENKKGKVRDFFIAVILYAIVALVNWWIFETYPLKSLALTFAFRILVFDYAIQYILIKRGVIHGHWFYYQGKTAKWDRVISYLNPWIVLAVRLLLFFSALLIMLLGRHHVAL